MEQPRCIRCNREARTNDSGFAAWEVADDGVSMVCPSCRIGGEQQAMFAAGWEISDYD
jgi:hypothetical protein